MEEVWCIEKNGRTIILKLATLHSCEVHRLLVLFLFRTIQCNFICLYIFQYKAIRSSWHIKIDIGKESYVIIC